MKIEVIEILLVCIIVSLQIYVFRRTFIQIRIFKNIVPAIGSLKVSRIPVPATDLELLSPKEILANVHMYKNRNVSATYYVSANGFDEDSENALSAVHDEYQESREVTDVNIIETDVRDNQVFDKILFSVNNYLIRNRGAASDFNLIKDIVQRNTDAVEEDINLSVGVPLYLGLMGTMIGIVMGLFNMPDLGAAFDTKEKDLLLNEGIALLIGGVKIAMIASFIGLLFTIINSGWVFKGSRSFNEARKNEFYTFIQIELLPIINQGLASTLESLQRNLVRFNNEFSSNLKGLTGIFEISRTSIREQKQLIEALDKTKVSEMTRYNVKVLEQLNVSVAQFEKFNAHIANVTQFVDNSQQLVSRTNELLARTDNFRNIADNLESKLNQSQQLMQFLSDHFSRLEEHKQFTADAVADVGHSISETFRELKVHIQHSSEAVKQFTVDETVALKDTLSASKTNLGNLEHLATIKYDVSQFKDNAVSHGERLKLSLEDLNRNMARSIAVLEQIEKSSLVNRTKEALRSVLNLFRSKK